MPVRRGVSVHSPKKPPVHPVPGVMREIHKSWSSEPAGGAAVRCIPEATSVILAN